MPPFVRSSALIAAMLLLLLTETGCVFTRHRKNTEAAPPSGPQLVGTITLVNDEERFALIDAGSGQLPATGVALKSFTGDVPSGVLNVGGVRRRPFVVADIVQGTPRKGDRVFQ